jgi:hypothetical protein
MKTINLIFSAILALTLVLSSCKKHEHENQENGNGQVTINLNHHWGMGTEPFKLDSTYKHPMNGDTMKFTKYKYYISNFKIKKADGTWWIHPESYFLVDLSNPASSTLDLGALPNGEYTELSYTLGVDSLRNVSGAQSGALSTTNNMFWSWNTGYIMIKAEGFSPQSTSGTFAFHLGGFKGAYNIVKTKTVDFSSNPLTITKDKKSEVHFNVNMAMTWCTSGSCAGTSSVMMPGALAYQMASDFHNGFVFDHIVE